MQWYQHILGEEFKTDACDLALNKYGVLNLSKGSRNLLAEVNNNIAKVAGKKE